MDLLAEQERALAYARRRGTEAPLADIRRRVGRAYSELEELVASVPAGVASRRPAPSAWSVQEVVDHLVLSDGLAAGQLEELLAGESSDAPIPAGLLSDRPLEAEWSALRAELGRVHGQILQLLDGASDDTPLVATAPVEMVVKCVTADGETRPVHWLERFDWKAYTILVYAHNREHIDQTHRVLAAVGNPPVRR